MQITARLPLLFQGKPSRNNGPKEIFVCKDFDWDIPEVSLHDMPVAFETAMAHTVDVSQTDARGYHRPKAFQRNTVFREYGGALYRKAASAGEDLDDLFSLAFPTQHASDKTTDYAKISYLADTWFNGGVSAPLSLPVYRQLVWQLKSRQIFDKDNESAWPASVPGVPDPTVNTADGSRNTVTFEDVLSKLRDYDNDDYDRCLDMYRHHMRTFLIADDELWARTPPPVFKVQRGWLGGKGSAIVSLCAAPDYHEKDLTVALFDLSSRDEAFEYAKDLIRIDADQRLEDGRIYDLTVDYDAPIPALVAYDHGAEELRRLSSGLAVEAHRFLKRNTPWVVRKKCGADVVEGIIRSYGEVQATNYVTGDYGDASPWLDSNADFWKSAGRRGYSYSFGRKTKFSDLLIERARAYENDSPINLEISPVHAASVNRL